MPEKGVEESGMTLNAEKCEFSCKRVKFLGHIMRDLLQRSRHFTHGFTDEKALYTGSTWGQLVGGQSYSVSSALYRSVWPAEETSDVAYYRTTLARSVLCTSVRFQSTDSSHKT